MHVSERKGERRSRAHFSHSNEQSHPSRARQTARCRHRPPQGCSCPHGQQHRATRLGAQWLGRFFQKNDGLNEEKHSHRKRRTHPAWHCQPRRWHGRSPGICPQLASRPCRCSWSISANETETDRDRKREREKGTLAHRLDLIFKLENHRPLCTAAPPPSLCSHAGIPTANGGRNPLGQVPPTYHGDTSEERCEGVEVELEDDGLNERLTGDCVGWRGEVDYLTAITHWPSPVMGMIRKDVVQELCCSLQSAFLCK